MKYEDLIVDVAHRAGLNTEMVRGVLFHLPDTLVQMDVGDNVRTPLGVFRAIQSKTRQITLPDQKTTATIPGKTTVRLKAGLRLMLED